MSAGLGRVEIGLNKYSALADCGNVQGGMPVWLGQRAATHRPSDNLNDSSESSNSILF
jgi:hypothetical protein